MDCKYKMLSSLLLLLLLANLLAQVRSEYDETVPRDDYQEPIFSVESKKHMYNTEITAELLVQVQERFATGCTIIWKNSKDSNEEMILARALVRRYVITSVISVDKLFEMKNHVGCRTRPMFVVFQRSALRTHLAKFTTAHPLTGPVWIMFLHRHSWTSLDTFFIGIYPRFDSEFLVVSTLENGQFEFEEVYKIRSITPLIRHPFGVWSLMAGFTGPNSQLGMNQRRNSLHNVTLNALITQNPPISSYVMNVWDLIQERINCSINRIYVSNESSNISGHNKWEKMLNTLANRNAHLLIEGVVVRNLNVGLVDFTMPLVASRSCIFIHASQRVMTNWRAYFTPFQVWLWVTIVLLILLVTTILLVLISLSNQDHLPQETRKIETWPDAFIYVFGIFCSQGLDLMRQTPSRLVIVSAHLTAVVLSAAYSSTVISLLAVQIEEKPFESMDGLLVDGTYRIMVLNESSELELFQTADESTPEKKIYKKFLSKEALLQPPTISEALYKLCNENKTKYAFMSPALSVKSTETHDTCPLTNTFCRHKVSFAYALAKNSPYRRIINHMLTQFRNVGILERVRESLLADGVTKTSESEWSAVSFEAVLPLLTILAGGSALALVTFILEKISEKNYKRETNSERNLQVKTLKKHPSFTDEVKIKRNLFG